MGRKKSNLISLSTYRKKKQKALSKKSRKAASDESLFIGEGKKSDSTSVDIWDEEQCAPVYYMKNYIQSKKKEDKGFESVSKNKPSYSKEQNDPAKTVSLLDYRTRKRSKGKKFSKNKEPGKLIFLEDYLGQKKAKLPNVKQAASYGAMVLTLLFALSIFFQQEGGNSSRGIASVPKSSDQKEVSNPSNWSQRLKEMDLTDQEVFFGEKPESSDYKGF